MEVTYPETINITLDLNGHHINGSDNPNLECEGNTACNVSGKINLTIRDSVGGGELIGGKGSDGDSWYDEVDYVIRYSGVGSGGIINSIANTKLYSGNLSLGENTFMIRQDDTSAAGNNILLASELESVNNSGVRTQAVSGVFSQVTRTQAVNGNIAVDYDSANAPVLSASATPIAGEVSYRWYLYGNYSPSLVENETDSVYTLPVGLGVGTYTYECVAIKDNISYSLGRVDVKINSGYVAQIGEVSYFSMNDAIAAINEGEILKLTANCNSTVNFANKAGSYIIDLNGYDIAVHEWGNNAIYSYSVCNLTIMDSVGGRTISSESNLSNRDIAIADGYCIVESCESNKWEGIFRNSNISDFYNTSIKLVKVNNFSSAVASNNLIAEEYTDAPVLCASVATDDEDIIIYKW